MNFREWLFGKRKFNFVGDIAHAKVSAGDVFILVSQRVLSAEQHAALQDHWKKYMPDHKLIVLDDGMKICIVSQDKAVVAK